jgi:hypothetical protein
MNTCSQSGSLSSANLPLNRQYDRVTLAIVKAMKHPTKMMRYLDVSSKSCGHTYR